MLAAIALICHTGWSQEEDKNLKRSEEVLREFSEKTESYESIKAEFTYKMENREAGINESKDGVIWISGDKYHLSIAGQVVISDGTTLWTYLRDADEVQVNTVEEDSESLTPSSLLTSYDDDYKSKFIKETFLYGTTVNIIELIPMEGKTYYKVRLVIDKDSHQLHEAAIFDKNGSTYSYVIKSFEPNINPEPGKFTFDPGDYPEVEVIDMR